MVPATLPDVSAAADTQPPSVPQGMRFAGRSRTSVALRWNAATDNVGVAGYRLLRNGVAIATVKQLRYTYARLTCGRTYTFALQAYDAAGNASNRAEATGRTATLACATKPAAKPKPPVAKPKPPALPRVGTHANLWVDASGGSRSRTAAAAAYVDARACSTLNAAYQAAANGDTILVRGGSYGRQVIAQKTAAAPPGMPASRPSPASLSCSGRWRSRGVSFRCQAHFGRSVSKSTPTETARPTHRSKVCSSTGSRSMATA